MAPKSLILAAAASSLLLRRDDHQKTNEMNSCGGGDHFCVTAHPFTVSENLGDWEDLYRNACYGRFGQSSKGFPSDFPQFKCDSDWQDAGNSTYDLALVAKGMQDRYQGLARMCNTTDCTDADSWWNGGSWCARSAQRITDLCNESADNLNNKVREAIELKFNKNKDGKRVTGYCKVNEEKLLDTIGLQSYVEQCLSKPGNRAQEHQWRNLCADQITTTLYGPVFDEQKFQNASILNLTWDANAQSCD